MRGSRCHTSVIVIVFNVIVRSGNRRIIKKKNYKRNVSSDGACVPFRSPGLVDGSSGRVCGRICSHIW